MDLQEKYEIKDLAKSTLDLLYQTENTLKGARNWGIYDIFGGGFFSSIIKHNKIDKAERLMRNAQDSLKKLQRKLKNTSYFALNPSVGVTGFERFMDIAFDNIFSDWLTQTRINDSLYEIRRLIDDVKEMVSALDSLD